MPRERDPLSVAYDGFSAEFLALLRADMYGWQYATVRSPAGDRIDARGLSSHERAVKRSLYYVLNSEVTPAGVRWVKNHAESLQVRWGAPEAGPSRYGDGQLTPAQRRREKHKQRGEFAERSRVLGCRLASGMFASKFVPPDGYVFNDAERAHNLQL